MRDLYLDPVVHDLVIVDRDLVIVEDPQAIAQNIKQRLLMFTQEWFLNLSEGTPWFEDILVKGQRQYIVEDILKTRIRDTPGVTELTAFELTQAGDRAVSVAFSATTETGVTVEEILEIAL